MKTTFFTLPKLLFFLLMMSACKTAKPVRSNEILGQPPTEKEDPFFFVTLPAQATEAQASGTIGQGQNEATLAKEKRPTVECFSCVKICPEGSSCSKPDSICGWGVSQDQERAILRATAECEGALNLARQDSQWKNIAGHCPLATCR